MSDESHDLFEPHPMLEIGKAESYLDVNRHIVRNTVAVNYLALCGISLPTGCNWIAPACAEERLLAMALAAERVLGYAARAALEPPQYSRRDSPRS